MIDQPLIDAVEWSVNLAFWSAVLFPAVIGLIWPWWRDWWGQNMIALDLCIAGTTLGLVLRYDWSVRSVSLAWVDVVSLSLSFAVIAWRAAMIFRAQRSRNGAPAGGRGEAPAGGPAADGGTAPAEALGEGCAP